MLLSAVCIPPFTFQVALIGSDNKAQIQSVKVGSQVGSDWIIEEGLKAGDRVVVEGTQKARPGSVVNPKAIALPAGGNSVASSGH